MIRVLTVAVLALAPGIAGAQAVVSDPVLEATARQQLAVQQQQLAVLDAIQALLQSHVSQPVAQAALSYAAQQAQHQATARDAAQAASASTGEQR